MIESHFQDNKLILNPFKLAVSDLYLVGCTIEEIGCTFFLFFSIGKRAKKHLSILP